MKFPEEIGLHLILKCNDKDRFEDNSRESRPDARRMSFWVLRDCFGHLYMMSGHDDSVCPELVLEKGNDYCWWKWDERKTQVLRLNDTMFGHVQKNQIIEIDLESCDAKR